jgi:hypothetical protein
LFCGLAETNQKLTRSSANEMSEGKGREITDAPFEGDAMPLITPGHWTYLLNSALPLPNSHVLSSLGRRLQTEYKGVVEAPLPDRLALLVRQLEGTIGDGAGPSEAPGQPVSQDPILRAVPPVRARD